jgi:hypothetical protein
MSAGLHQRVDTLLKEIVESVETVKHRLTEEAMLHRRDYLSRIVRRVRENGTPLTRDVLRSRRERKQRDRDHAMKGLRTVQGKKLKPRKVFSTHLRRR